MISLFGFVVVANLVKKSFHISADYLNFFIIKRNCIRKKIIATSIIYILNSCTFIDKLKINDTEMVLKTKALIPSEVEHLRRKNK